ncbi:hypothetical protein ACEZDB_10385 [Streptacidiphilus sp. N1-3]|uniref:Uncharacterized protein n=1 Tax=Streptacidiphilus alkalitolerans TaxID=3342712 RepID=A0ABV6WYF0_9ACTN
MRPVDIGSGGGYLIRWPASTGALGPDVELISADLNGALVGEATRLALAEQLNCRFVHGLSVGAVLLTATDSNRTLGALTAGGAGYLLPPAGYAGIVLVSLAAYFTFPFWGATLAMVIGLGPLTLLRPLVIAAACLGALASGGGWTSLLVGVVAGVAMLGVEPLVHRRWYSRPL